MMQSPGPTTNHLDQQAKLYTFVSVVALGVSAILTGFLIMLSNQEVKKINTGRQELSSLQSSSKSIESLQVFAQTNQAEIKKIETLFPAEDDFVYVLQDIEAVVKASDPLGVVKVGAGKPTKIQNQNTIPLTIHLSGSSTSAISFLRQFERLPYILQITNLEFKGSPSLQDTLQIIMTVRLYVADSFNS